MSFMEAEITEKQTWLEIDGNCGTEFIPCDVADLTDEEIGAFNETADDTTPGWMPIPSAIRDYCESRTAVQIDRVTGYGVRLSAAGYMDCTEWSVYATKREALAAARELSSDE